MKSPKNQKSLLSRFKSKIGMMLCLVVTLCNPLRAADDRGPKDPFLSIRYTSAFNQDDVWQDHRQLMQHLGCAQNVFEGYDESQDVVIDMPDSDSEGDAGYHAISMEHQDFAHELDRYQLECISKLNKARRLALAEPGMYAVAEMGLMGGGALATMSFLGSGSMGGSFAAFSAIFNTLHKLPGTIKSAHNLISWPDNPLESYEDLFAKNKCFIPRALWPKIIRELMSARQNEFSRENHTSFLNFALGFTTYKPQPALQSKENMSRDAVKTELGRRIDLYFNQYVIKPEAVRELNFIKLNVDKFVDQLFDRTAAPAPRYVYLYGPGGIGKTHFVEQLSQWIEELLPQSVNFESVVVNNAQELEGTESRPGALLKVLHNQLAQNKRGSVVVLDEATWLNEQPMIPCAKRTFNVDQSKLCTSYFGNGPDGEGVPLAVPPMLIFVASNDDIQDDALASRFDVVHYPAPSKEALIAHAAKVARESRALRRADIIVERDAIERWIDHLDPRLLNFRSVAGRIEADFLGNADRAPIASSSSE